jgi:hypothetical protein
MSDRLTAKQERFVQALVSGMSQREAYLTAYNAQGMKPRSIDVAACRVFDRANVRLRHDELLALSAQAACWTREKAIADLLEVRSIALGHIRQTTGHKVHFDEHDKRDLADLPSNAVKLVVSSTAELNKLCGFYDGPGGDDGKVVIVDNIPGPSDG